MIRCQVPNLTTTQAAVAVLVANRAPFGGGEMRGQQSDPRATAMNTNKRQRASFLPEYRIRLISNNFPLVLFVSICWIVMPSLTVTNTASGAVALARLVIVLVVLAAIRAGMLAVLFAPIRMQFALLIHSSLSPLAAALKTPRVSTVSIACIDRKRLDWLFLAALLTRFDRRGAQIGLDTGLFHLIRSLDRSIPRALGIGSGRLAFRRGVSSVVMYLCACLAPRHIAVVTTRALVKLLDWFGFSTLGTRFHQIPFCK